MVASADPVALSIIARTCFSEKVGKISKAQLKQIAEEKFKDFNTADLEAAMRTIAGTARSMGITVEA